MANQYCTGIGKHYLNCTKSCDMGTKTQDNNFLALGTTYTLAGDSRCVYRVPTNLATNSTETDLKVQSKDGGIVIYQRTYGYSLTNTDKVYMVPVNTNTASLKKNNYVLVINTSNLTQTFVTLA